MKINFWIAALLTCLLDSHAMASHLTMDAIREIVKTNKPETIDAFVALLPESMRHSPVLIYKSRTVLQGASFESPRVVLTSSDAKLLLSFGGTGMRGEKTVEVIEFNDSKKTFDFHLLVFDKENETVSIRESLLDSLKTETFHRIEGSTVQVATNPKLCLNCHGTRPIWDSHPVWPGFFGSSEEFINKASNRGPEAEHAALEHFAKTLNSHSRYRHLLGVDGDILNQARINGNVTERLNRLNIEKIFTELKQNPGYSLFRAPLLGALQGMQLSEMRESFPNLTNWAQAEGHYQVILDDIKRRMKKYLDGRATRMLALNGPGEYKQYAELTTPGNTPRLAMARFVLEHFYGARIRDWTMTIDGDSYAFFSPESNFASLAAPIASDAGIILTANREHFRNQLKHLYSNDLLRCRSLLNPETSKISSKY